MYPDTGQASTVIETFGSLDSDTSDLTPDSSPGRLSFMADEIAGSGTRLITYDPGSGSTTNVDVIAIGA